MKESKLFWWAWGFLGGVIFMLWVILIFSGAWT